MKNKTMINAIKTSPFVGRTIAIITFLTVIINQFFIYKASLPLFTSNGGLKEISIHQLEYLISDLLVFIIILGFVLISYISKKTLIKILNNIIISVIFFFFLLDKFTLHIFQSSISVFDIPQFINNSLSSFYILIVSTLIFVFLIIFFIFITIQKPQFKRNHKSFLTIFILFFVNSSLILTILSTNGFKQLPTNIISFNLANIQEWFANKIQLKQVTNKNDVTNYEEFFKEYKGKNKTGNIIVVFAESLSAVDSMHIAGVNNKLPHFDKIQRDGITFRNFIANGCTSDTAHISLLLGIDPLKLLGSHISAYSGYKSISNPLPQFFNEIGYKSIFVSAVDLGFLNQLEFLSGVGFSEIIGPEHFKDEKKYVFNAAPDEFLFKKTLEIVSSQKEPYFLALQTISFHKPYDTPYGKTHNDALKYADETLYNFYTGLQKLGFFEDGILVIIGDHRKMDSIEPGEEENFGDSRYARSLATVVGKNIKPGSVNNNLIQITDFFYSIKQYFSSGKVELLNLYNDIFSNNKSRNWGLTYCRNKFSNKTNVVFEDSSKFPVSSMEQLKKSYPDIYPYFYSYFNFQYGNNNETENKITFIGHRGEPIGNTENSLAGFFTAKKYGANGIEFDVSFTKDKHNVVIHGPKPYNTNCGNKKDINTYTLQELQEKCLLNNGETIKTLNEMLSATDGLFNLYFLEIKITNDLDAEQQTLDAIDTVKELNMQKKVVFISYHDKAKEILGSTEGIIAGWDTFDPNDLAPIQNSSFEYFLLPYDLITKELVNEVNNLGKKIVTYTVNTTGDLLEVYEKGVNIIMTDNIPLLKNWAQKNLE